MTAQLGSVYDMPMPSERSELETAASSHQRSFTVGGGSITTKASSTMPQPQSSMRFSSTSRLFQQTEGATYKPNFKTFYTNSEMEVKYTTVNKFEGRSNYFSYFPTDDLKELQLEQVWWRH